VYLVNENKLEKSEVLLKIIEKVSNLNNKIWDLVEPYYQLNLKNFNGELLSYSKKRVFVYEALSSESFEFKNIFYIKKYIYNLTKNEFKKIKINKKNLNFTEKFSKIINIYNNETIYDKIELKQKILHCKVYAYFDNIKIEIPPIGICKNGLPFFNDKQINELQSSGWWIEGKSIKFFINSFNLSNTKQIKIEVIYNKKNI